MFKGSCVTIDRNKVIEVYPLNSKKEKACYQQQFFMASSLCHSLVRYTVGGTFIEAELMRENTFERHSLVGREVLQLF